MILFSKWLNQARRRKIVALKRRILVLRREARKVKKEKSRLSSQLRMSSS